jgi:phytol kinase
MGLVTLFFPWMFPDSSWPVLILAVLSIVLLLSLRRLRALKDTVGQVVGGVGRLSFGEIYFPIAVAILFHIYLYVPWEPPPVDAHRQLLLYIIPILLLALGDAAAALIGISYGRLYYLTADGRKTAEGSLALFLIAFFCVHVPLLLTTNTGRPETLLIALLMAMLVVLFEAVAWSGLDNLLLPLASYLFLRVYLGLSFDDLVSRLMITGLLILVLLIYTRRATLVVNAVLGAFLVGYITWSLGGWQWLLAPVTVYLSYTWFAPRTASNRRRIHNIHAVVCVASTGLCWLFLDRLLNWPQLLFPYTLSYAAHLAIIGVIRLRRCEQRLSAPVLIGVAGFVGWALLLGPYLVIQAWFPARAFENSTTTLAWQVVFGIGGVLLAAAAFYCTQPGLHDCPADGRRWLRQAVHAGLVSSLGLAAVYFL